MITDYWSARQTTMQFRLTVRDAAGAARDISGSDFSARLIGAGGTLDFAIARTGNAGEIEGVAAQPAIAALPEGIYSLVISERLTTAAAAKQQETTPVTVGLRPRDVGHLPARLKGVAGPVLRLDVALEDRAGAALDMAARTARLTLRGPVAQAMTVTEPGGGQIAGVITEAESDAMPAGRYAIDMDQDDGAVGQAFELVAINFTREVLP